MTHLSERTARALRWAKSIEPRAQHLVLAGGVARNTLVRSTLTAAAARAGFECIAPPPALCSDNGVMVAWAGIERLALGLVSAQPRIGGDAAAEFTALTGRDPTLWVDVKARWPLGDRHPDSLASLSATRSLKKVRLEVPLTGVGG